MSQERPRGLAVLADLIRRFELDSLLPVLQACEALAGEDAFLDVAVLGQFKSGKSSLLNALLGADVFPVGALPVTAVVTRARAGPALSVRARHLDGTEEEVEPGRIAEFVTEAGNPHNRRQVAVVDVYSPALRRWPGLRLVDTPGLGSVFAHNTQATRDWLPNVAVALVVVSAERPLAEEDRRLLDEARRHAPRVVVVLSKVDLLSQAERQEMLAFLDRALRETGGGPVPLLPFSARVDRDSFASRLEEEVLLPLTRDLAGRRREALAHKQGHLVRACRGYLEVGLQAAERADEDRARLRAAVLDESVNAAVIRDELLLAEQRVCEGTRPAFEKALLAQEPAVRRRLTDELRAELPTWTGNLARQTERYEAWMARRLAEELAPLSAEAAPLGAELLGQAEGRFRRVVEAFRDRLGRNIHAATGVTISPAAWEVRRPELAVVPVAVGRTFMVHWDLLWWLLPMWLVGGLFRRHALGRVPWEVEKNLTRLAGDWAAAVDRAVADLRGQAVAWVDAELATLDRLLGQRPVAAGAFSEALRQLAEMAESQAEEDGTPGS
jgi:GTP-binding protein EngB required for normal cell division